MIWHIFNVKTAIYRDSTIVSFADCFTSILAGITIFSILGNLAYETGQLDDIGNIVQNGGSGLAFVSYPEAISKFDDVPQVCLIEWRCVIKGLLIKFSKYSSYFQFYSSSC